jgi:hypothetical protein
MEPKGRWNVLSGWRAIARNALLRTRTRPRALAGDIMDTTTLLIIVLVIVLLGGGGWYGRGRWF